MTHDVHRSRAARAAALTAASLLLALGAAVPASAQASPEPSAEPTASATGAPDPGAPAPEEPEPEAPSSDAPAAPATATNENRFSLSAAADGMLFEIQNKKVPANIVVAAAPVSSFASVDSAGSSRAFAGLPYFGPSVQTLPGTVNGLSGGLTPPIPPIPGYVESRFPGDPKVQEAQGPYVISAESTETTSTARAGAGTSPNAVDPQQQAYSTSDVKALPDGSVVSYATAGATGLSLGPLKILDVSAAEKITETGDGTPKIESRTDLGTIKVAGFTLGIDEKGFNLLGAPIAIPAKQALAAVSAALAGAHMEIAYIPRKVVKDTANDVTTVTSGSLRVTTLQDVPIQGPTTVIYTYARVAVSTSSVATPEDAAVGEDTGVPAPAPAAPDAGGAAPSGDAGLSPGSALPEAASDPGQAPDVATSPDLQPAASEGTVGSDPGGAAESPSVAGPGTAAGPTLTLGNAQTAERGDGTLVYLALVLGGAGIFVGQQTFSRFGIRLLMRT